MGDVAVGIVKRIEHNPNISHIRITGIGVTNDHLSSALQKLGFKAKLHPMDPGKRIQASVLKVIGYATLGVPQLGIPILGFGAFKKLVKIALGGKDYILEIALLPVEENLNVK